MVNASYYVPQQTRQISCCITIITYASVSCLCALQVCIKHILLGTRDKEMKQSPTIWHNKHVSPTKTCPFQTNKSITITKIIFIYDRNWPSVKHRLCLCLYSTEYRATISVSLLPYCITLYSKLIVWVVLLSYLVLLTEHTFSPSPLSGNLS